MQPQERKESIFRSKSLLMLHTAGAHLLIFMVPHVAISHCGTTEFLSMKHFLTAHIGKANYSVTFATRSLWEIFSQRLVF